MHPFNTYTIGLDLASLKDYCIRHGKLKKFSRGDFFETEGMPSHWIGYVIKGCFKYVVQNKAEGKDYITGFAFNEEFVGDFPNCMSHHPAAISIVAMNTSKVYVIDEKELTNVLKEQDFGNIFKHLFGQIYSQYLDSYRMTPKERYLHLLHRCPQIVQQINLKDIASFLRVTPTTISNIRRGITFTE